MRAQAQTPIFWVTRATADARRYVFNTEAHPFAVGDLIMRPAGRSGGSNTSSTMGGALRAESDESPGESVDGGPLFWQKLFDDMAVA